MFVGSVWPKRMSNFRVMRLFYLAISQCGHFARTQEMCCGLVTRQLLRLWCWQGWLGRRGRHVQLALGRGPLQFPKRRVIRRSHKSLKPREWRMRCFYHCGIWQATRQGVQQLKISTLAPSRFCEYFWWVVWLDDQTIQGLYSLSGKTSYCKISWSIESARFAVIMIVSLCRDAC